LTFQNTSGKTPSQISGKHPKDVNFKWDRHCFPKIELVESDDGPRRYRVPNGAEYISVTTKLKELSREAIENWRKKIGQDKADEISFQSADRGSSLHLIAEGYLNNDPCYRKKRMPSDLYLFDQIRPVINSNVALVRATEVGVFSHKYKAAGTADVFAVYEDVNSVLDFKTSTKPKKESWILAYFIQATMYSLMIEEIFPEIKIPQIVIIIAVQSENCPQVFVKRKEEFIPELEKIFVPTC
jgi:hypothetical protein